MSKDTNMENAKKKRSPGVTAALFGILLLLLLALAVLLFVGSKLNKINYSDGTLPSGAAGGESLGAENDGNTVDISGLEQWDAPELAEMDVLKDEQVLNILLLGTDDRTLDFSDDARADAILLVSLDFGKGSGKLVSFERGMGVPILSGVYEGKYDWITHCFRYGGASLMLQEVRTCFNVDVDRYVRVNINALVKVVDVLGGIDVELTELEAWYLNTVASGGSVGSYSFVPIYSGDGDSEIRSDLVPGVNHLSGAMAVGYARLRAIDSDWQRIVRQRTVIQACADRLKDADLLTLNRLADEILPLVETNFTQAEILSLLLKAPSLLGLTLDQMTIPVDGTYGGMTGLGGRGMFAPDFALNSQLLREFLYGKESD